MSFEHDPADGAVLYGPTGDVIWSSARKQIYWTDYVSGSFVIPAMPASSQSSTAYILTTDTFNLEAVSSNATHVMGSMEAFHTGGALPGGMVLGGIHQLGGTTILMGVTFDMYPSDYDVTPHLFRYGTWTTGLTTNYAGAMTLTTFVEDGWLKAKLHRSKPYAAPGVPASWGGMGFFATTIYYQGVAYTFDN